MSESAQRRTDQIKLLLRNGEHAAALAILDQKIAEQPAQAPLHWHRANCLAALGRNEQALAAVVRVIELQPDFARAWLRRAELATVLHGDYPEREGDLQLAVALDARLAPAHRALALLQYARGRFDEALTSLGKALELDPNDGEGHAVRAWWASSAARSLAPGEDSVPQPNGTKLSRRRLESAVADLRKAVVLVPDPSRYRMQLGRRLQELQRYAEAAVEYERLLAALPEGHVLRSVAAEMRRAALDQLARQSPRETPPPVVPAPQLSQQAELPAAAAAPKKTAPAAEPAIGIPESPYRLGHLPGSDFRPVPAELFPRFMRRFAERARPQMADLGFAYLGDYDPQHLAAELGEKTLLRCYRSTDGSVVAASFALRPGRIGGSRLRLARWYQVARVIEFETRFTDGHLLVTNNSGARGDHSHEVDLAAMSPATAAPFLFARHCSRRDAYLQQHPGVSVVAAPRMPALAAMRDVLSQAAA